MRITHIYHSGFAVDLACCTLLFDWYTGELPRLRYDLPLVTLVSHEHSDHYGRCIWSLREQFPNVRYVLDPGVQRRGRGISRPCLWHLGLLLGRPQLVAVGTPGRAERGVREVLPHGALAHRPWPR